MWHVILSGVVATGLFALLGRRIGRRLFPEESRGFSTVIGALLIIATLSIVGAIVYYAAPVTAFSLTIAAIIGMLLLEIGTRRLDRENRRQVVDEPRTQNVSHRGSQIVPLAIIAVISLIAWWTAIIGAPITDAVRSPWLVLSPLAIIAPAIAIIASFALLKIQKTIGSIVLFASLFSAFASAAVLFPLGYGFDPFLHRATILHIAEYGTITPKPLYYIGEYALTLYAHLLGGLSIFTVDVLLVPLLGALALTVAARRLALGAAIFLIPLGAFVATTPQSLGYIFALLAVVTSATLPTERKHFLAPMLFSVAACFAHPVAGVPAVLFVLLTMARYRNLRGGIIVLSAIALPAMFILQAALSGAPITIFWTNLWRLDLLPLTSFLSTQGNPWLDALYLVIANLTVIAFILASIGAIARRGAETRAERNSGIIALTLVASFICIALGIDFTYLITYERNDFALRLLFLATLFALPLVDSGIATIWKHLSARRLTAPAIALGTIIIFASFYNLYPRHDGYTRSAAFNVSRADLNTVYAINALETADSDYIVLANQATSAAALQEFGFRKYYPGDIFYYPIPTGGALYQEYLSMVEDMPSQETIDRAMALTDVDTAYFVVSEYWWQSDAIIEHAKQLTDEWFAVDGGKTTVFVFTADEASR